MQTTSKQQAIITQIGLKFSATRDNLASHWVAEPRELYNGLGYYHEWITQIEMKHEVRSTTKSNEYHSISICSTKDASGYMK